MCPCGGEYDDQVIEVRMSVRGEPIAVGGVPQGACPRCGGRVYRVDTLERIESLYRAGRTDPRTRRDAVGSGSAGASAAS